MRRNRLVGRSGAIVVVVSGALSLSILGPMTATVGDRPVLLGGPKQRSVLAILLLDPNRVVSVDRLVEGVWGHEAHDRATSTLQVYLSNLRKAFAEAGHGADLLLTQRPGYRAVVADHELDSLHFEQLRRDASAVVESDPAAALALYDEALALWRGEPFADLEYEPFASSASVVLLERRDVVVEQRFDAALRSGRHRELIGELEAAVAAHPLREALRGQLMLALYRSGRQADALAAYRQARETLLDELGIDPGAELRALESQILSQDPALDLDGTPSPRPPTLDPTVRRVVPDRPGALVLGNGERVELGDRTVVIGRDPSCDIVLASPDVSRRHAEIGPSGNGHELRDLGSTNGLTVNDEDVTQRRLEVGDVIVIGTSRFRYDL